ALLQTADGAAPTLRAAAATLAAIGVESGASVRVRQGHGETVLVARLDDKVPAGCVRVAAAHPTTAMLGEMFGDITVERA
ncbi:MAG: NADH-quinone oxidoreductase subunit G, partial [Dechloromonas sp.]|nr:NADH-quinone oxidoreductase subunit G [Dechloromonas sp.]